MFSRLGCTWVGCSRPQFHIDDVMMLPSPAEPGQGASLACRRSAHGSCLGHFPRLRRRCRHEATQFVIGDRFRHPGFQVMHDHIGIVGNGHRLRQNLRFPSTPGFACQEEGGPGFGRDYAGGFAGLWNEASLYFSANSRALLGAVDRILGQATHDHLLDFRRDPVAGADLARSSAGSSVAWAKARPSFPLARTATFPSTVRTGSRRRCTGIATVIDCPRRALVPAKYSQACRPRNRVPVAFADVSCRCRWLVDEFARPNP